MSVVYDEAPVEAANPQTTMRGASNYPTAAQIAAAARQIEVPSPRQIVASNAARTRTGNMDESMVLNMGPHHPSTHGVLRLVVELSGETVLQLAPDVGFLHTGIEKTIESKTYQKAVVLTDRTDYLNPLNNNFVYALAIEKLLDCEIPERAQVTRVLLSELIAHQQPPGMAWYARARPRGDERLLVLLPRTRTVARYLRVGVGRTHDDQLYPSWRPGL